MTTWMSTVDRQVSVTTTATTGSQDRWSVDVVRAEPVEDRGRDDDLGRNSARLKARLQRGAALRDADGTARPAAGPAAASAGRARTGRHQRDLGQRDRVGLARGTRCATWLASATRKAANRTAATHQCWPAGPVCIRPEAIQVAPARRRSARGQDHRAVTTQNRPARHARRSLRHERSGGRGRPCEHATPTVRRVPAPLRSGPTGANYSDARPPDPASPLHQVQDWPSA